MVASDRCPNACFSVLAEQSRWARQGQERKLEVRRSDLFDDLQNEELPGFSSVFIGFHCVFLMFSSVFIGFHMVFSLFHHVSSMGADVLRSPSTSSSSTPHGFLAQRSTTATRRLRRWSSATIILRSSSRGFLRRPRRCWRRRGISLCSFRTMPSAVASWSDRRWSASPPRKASSCGRCSAAWWRTGEGIGRRDETKLGRRGMKVRQEVYTRDVQDIFYYIII